MSTYPIPSIPIDINALKYREQVLLLRVKFPLGNGDIKSVASSIGWSLKTVRRSLATLHALGVVKSVTTTQPTLYNGFTHRTDWIMCPRPVAVQPSKVVPPLAAVALDGFNASNEQPHRNNPRSSRTSTRGSNGGNRGGKGSRINTRRK